MSFQMPEFENTRETSPITTHIYPPSISSIRDLKKIHINDLTAKTNHRGYFLLLRAVTEPVCLAKGGTQVLVQDDSGRGDENDLALLRLYNCVDEFMIRNLSSWITIGTVLLVKEPYCCIPSSEEIADRCVRVDHVSDFVVLVEEGLGEKFYSLRDCHELGGGKLLKTVVEIPVGWKRTNTSTAAMSEEEWKDRGNSFFKSGNFYEAVRCYTEGLKVANSSSSSASILRLNRIQAYISLGFHEKALNESDFILETYQTNEKALFRSAKACYILAQFEQSKKRLEKLLAVYPGNGEAKSLLVRTERRLEEAKTGKYDFSELHAILNRSGIEGVENLDIANYKSSVIEIREIEGMGKGVVAIKDIEPGELLIMEKAWVSSFELEHGLSLGFSNMGLKEKSIGTHAQALVKMLSIMKAWKWPERCRREMLPLWNGNYERVDEGGQFLELDGRPVMDSFLINQIRSLNSFGCMLSSLNEIVSDSSARGESDDNGFWITPSYFNHTCVGNCYRSFIGDVMIVRTARRISRGEQLTMPYIVLSDVDGIMKPQSCEERQEKFKEIWGFQCSCSICSCEQIDSVIVREKRYELFRSVSETVQAIRSRHLERKKLGPQADVTFMDLIAFDLHAKAQITNLWEKIRELESLYPASRPPSECPRLELAFAIRDTMNIAYTFLGSCEECLIGEKRTLHAFGWVIKYPEKNRAKMGEPKLQVDVRKWGFLFPDILECWDCMWHYWAVKASDGERTEHEREKLQNIADAYKVMVKKVLTVLTGSEVGWDAYEERMEGSKEAIIIAKRQP